MRDTVSPRITVIWMVVIFSLVSSGGCSEQGESVPDEDTGRQGMLEHVKSLDTTIHFYGKVVDQYRRPIDGAKVSVGIRRFSAVGTYFMESKNLTVTTGLDGLFEVFELRGAELFIGEIEREGYEFSRVENRNNSFEFGVGKGMIGPPSFTPDKNNPVIFRLRRKRMDRTFLFEKPEWSIRVLVEESGMLKGTDFIEGKWSRMPGEKARDSRSEICDLFYRATYDEKTDEWHVILRPGGPDGGIQVNDRMLYVAPEDGYQSELSFVPEGRAMPSGAFVYLKTRTPSIYSRIEVIDIIASDRFWHLHGEVVTNPYGDRVLDSVDFPPYSVNPEIERIYQVGDRLEEEAKAALREGRLPPRPKIMALIEAAKRGEE